MQTLIFNIIGGLFAFIPALVANPGAVIAGGYGKIDGGKNFLDGNRILGDGKTISGYAGGIAIGAITGFIILEILNYTHFAISGYTPETLIFVSILLAWGSLTGDMVGSFIKRRINMKRGQRGNLLDMWPFVIFAFIFLLLGETHFFFDLYGNFIDIVIIMAITPFLHRGVNILAYKMHRKDVPW
jgi:CDP-diglyceride synthetase